MEASKIAAAVQAGQADRLELWEAVRRFAMIGHIVGQGDGRARRHGSGGLHTSGVPGSSGGTGELGPRRRGIPHLVRFEAEGGFTEAVGMRTQRDKRDPIHHALSLDAPLTDSESGEDFTLADVIEDPYAAAGVEAVAELDYQRRRTQALATALDGLTEDQRRAVVLRHCNGLTLDQTAARMGTTRATARAAEQKGLRLLRHPKNRELRQYC